MAASLPFHPLCDSLLHPRGRATVRFLSHEAVGEFVLQDVRQIRRNTRQSLYGNTQAPIVERAYPSWRLGNIGERLSGVKNDGNLLRRRIRKLRFKIRE